MAVKTESGDWIIQASYTLPGGLLLNLRGRTQEEFTQALEILTESKDTMEAVIATLRPAAPAPSTATRTNEVPSGPRPAPGPRAVEGPNPGATQVGDFWVKTIDVTKVYPKRETGTMNKFGKPNHKPGTIVDQNGRKYDTFDDDLLALPGNNPGAKFNVAYRVDETYGSFKIVDKGLTLHGVVATAAGDEY